MRKERYSIRKSTNQPGRFDVFLSGFTAMYCNSFDSKEEAREYIKTQHEYYKNYSRS